MPKGALLEPWLGGARFLMETQRDRLVASHDGDTDPRLSPQSFRVRGVLLRPLLVLSHLHLLPRGS